MTSRLSFRTFAAAAFLVMLLGCVHPANAASLEGVVTYADGSPAGGAVVYALAKQYGALVIHDNTVLFAETRPRALTDARGQFTLDGLEGDAVGLLARDMEDQCGLISAVGLSKQVQIVIQRGSRVTGELLAGDDPIKRQAVTAELQCGDMPIRFDQSDVTDDAGRFSFSGLMPGGYTFRVIEEVPQVGCCFRAVVTKQLAIALLPNESKAIKLGGTDLPYVTGKVTDTSGEALHGVWVRLIPLSGKDGDSVRADSGPQVVWSAVTSREGQYAIYDVPAGEYTLRCFRRLALNNATRTLEATQRVSVNAVGPGGAERGRRERVCDVAIDLEPFMPLSYGQQAPSFSAPLLGDGRFDLESYRGRIIVLHFFASWCAACVAGIGEFDALADSFPEEKLTVLGVSLDESIEDARAFAAQKHIRHKVAFDGSWSESSIRKAYRVDGIPATFIIDGEGNIAQINLFGDVLKNFLHSLEKAPAGAQ